MGSSMNTPLQADMLQARIETTVACRTLTATEILCVVLKTIDRSNLVGGSDGVCRIGPRSSFEVSLLKRIRFMILTDTEGILLTKLNIAVEIAKTSSVSETAWGIQETFATRKVH